MKSRHQSYHYQPEHQLPCASYHPLNSDELRELLTDFRFCADHYKRMSMMRRVEQGIAGMTTPNPTSGPVFEAARLAINLFISCAAGDETKSIAALRDLLGINQPELQLAAA